MIIDLKKLFSVPYLFSPFAGELSRPFLVVWLALAVVFFVAGVGVQFWLRWTTRLPAWEKWWRRVSRALIVSGCFTLLFLFFRYEQTPWLAARFWMLFFGAAALGWFGLLVWQAQTSVPQEAALEREDRRRRRYLP